MTQEALKLALEALKGLKSMYGGNGHKLHEINMIHRKHDTAITALEEALAQTQEPVAWMKDCADFWDYYICLNETAQEKYDQETQIWIKTLRTTPPQRTWVGLTDKEKETATGWSVEHIESYLKQKNGYAEEKNT